jgi:methionyl-tRNA formyltransferase
MSSRGVRFVEGLKRLAADARIEVFSWHEDPWEPRFLADLEAFQDARCRLHVTKDLAAGPLSELWQARQVDLLLMVGWRYLVPMSICDSTRLGSFVFHDSLLPAYRGFAPTCWAILNGQDHTGVTLLRAVEDTDAGDVVRQVRIPIADDDYIGTVRERVTDAYLNMLEDRLPSLLSGHVDAIPQDHSLATYCSKRVPEDNLIDWSRPARCVYNLIRGVSRPYPGAYTFLEERRLIVWAADLAGPLYVGNTPGAVVQVSGREGVLVTCGDGRCLRLTELQLEPDEARPADAVLTSLSQRLGATPSWTGQRRS